jgi:N-acetylmuramoyl-L-alanine amidase
MTRLKILTGVTCAMLAVQACAHNRTRSIGNTVAENSADQINRMTEEAQPQQSAPAPAADRTAKAFRVAIDIGHTPQKAGAAAADGIMEYEFNKRMARLVATDLRQQGIDVLLINEEGKEISLVRRSLVANAAKADLFLAIHHDSVNDRYLTRRTVNGRVLYECDKFHGYSVFFSKKNAKENASFSFAKTLGSAMREEGLAPTAHHAENIPGENRELVVPEVGVYRFDNLVVLKTAQMPAALLECGVIVNPGEEAELKQPARQEKTVRAVQKAVLAMAQANRAAAEEPPVTSPKQD